MMNKYYLLLFTFMIWNSVGLFAQNQQEYQWIDAAKDDRIRFEGQGWSHDVMASPFDRLPATAEKDVRKAVWNLSRNSAGIYLTFSTDASEIRVRYQVAGGIQMPHMPATGVSGLDLYMENVSGEQLTWCAGRYHFGDTVSYTFTDLHSRHGSGASARTYRLYLPLYNSVNWLEIGISSENDFYTVSSESKKPVVIYGTSIAQGGCASRPGMAWTNIVQRNLNRPVINLGFSGNGRLETEVVDLIKEIDASLFVLDCLPNLTNHETFPEDELKKRVIESVKTMKAKYPRTPILLTDHAGYPNERFSENAYVRVKNVNQWQQEAVEQLRSEGIKDLYILSKSEIDMCMDCTVDYVHQTDLGMEYYARSYLRVINQILHGAP